MQRIATAAAEMLTGRLLPFLESPLRDNAFGGYYGYMDFDHRLDKGAEKGCILNSRILWFFSEAAMTLKEDALIPYARHAYDFLRESCLDRECGGVYWSLTYDGKPLDDTKHTYNQAFAIYALSAYYRLTGEDEALKTARELFRLIEEKCTDENGYLEAFTRDFQPASNEKLSENGVLAERTMNTLLHVFEGYAGLYQAAKDPAVGDAMGHILGLYAKVYNPEKRRQEVFFDKGYNSLIDLTSYGHDIESSWLIDWGCGLLENPILTEKIAAINSALAGSVLKAAFRNGSLANECENGVTDAHRIWWVQAEALLGFINEWGKHPDRTNCRDAAVELWRFINEKVEDRRPGGEWYWRLDEHGEPDRAKPTVEPWKCPYHNGRMCLELIRRDPDVYV